mmetsp:Transcript_58943/g.63623  ORF Transcript_58943/g.63623 Transcript_58943/m.63623 type:complete len:141 (+) Transcript_58943:100-522(+)
MSTETDESRDRQKLGLPVTRNNEVVSSPVEIFQNHHIRPVLERRRENGSLRQMNVYSSRKSRSASPMIDFSSNDYLGLAQSVQQQQQVDEQGGSSSSSSSSVTTRAFLYGKRFSPQGTRCCWYKNNRDCSVVRFVLAPQV